MDDCQPVICDPKFCIHDYYTERKVPYIHPVVHIYRENIVNVPEHIYQPVSRHELVDPGCPTCCKKDKHDKHCKKHHCREEHHH